MGNPLLTATKIICCSSSNVNQVFKDALQRLRQLKPFAFRFAAKLEEPKVPVPNYGVAPGVRGLVASFCSVSLSLSFFFFFFSLSLSLSLFLSFSLSLFLSFSLSLFLSFSLSLFLSFSLSLFLSFSLSLSLSLSLFVPQRVGTALCMSEIQACPRQLNIYIYTY